MRGRRAVSGALAAITLLAAGCALWPFDRRSAAMLERADRLVAAGQYDEAVAAYDAFLARYPDGATGSRVRASRDAAASIAAARTELARLREALAARERDVARLQGELATRLGDLTRLREELSARQAEAARLRDDLERLKQVDLHLERRRR